MNARKECLETVGKEYDLASESQRSSLLDQAEKRTGLHGRYLIRILNHPAESCLRRRRKRRTEHGAATITALAHVGPSSSSPGGSG